MDVTAWIPTLISVLALLAAVVFGVVNAKQTANSAAHAKRSADSSERSLDLSQKQLESSTTAQAESLRLAQVQLENSVRAHQDSITPYVWADVRTCEDGSGFMEFVVGNSGLTVARNVHIEFQPALDYLVPPNAVEEATRVQARLREGLKSLPPGRVFAWILGMAQDYFDVNNPQPAREILLTITALGPHGPIAPTSYSISLEDMKHQVLRPVGLGMVQAPLKDVEQRLREIKTVLEKAGRALKADRSEGSATLTKARSEKGPKEV